MNMGILKPKRGQGWLLTFGDVITLLIVFFVLIIATTRGEISKAQQWVEFVLDQSYETLNHRLELLQLDNIKAYRTSRGILIQPQQDSPFYRGTAQIKPEIAQQISQIARLIPQLKIIRLNEEDYKVFFQALAHKKLKFRSQILVQGFAQDKDAHKSLSLSWQRAAAIRQILRENTNLLPEQILTLGLGQRQPLIQHNQTQGFNIYITATIERDLSQIPAE